MKLHNLTKRRKRSYNKIGSVECPILGNKVHFTSEGFHHLIYQSNNKPRTVSERFMKLMCLKHAPSVVMNADKVEARENTRKVKGKFKNVIQYELVYEVHKDAKMRVVVEKQGKGKLKFRSIMPHNNKSKNIFTRRTKKRR